MKCVCREGGGEVAEGGGWGVEVELTWRALVGTRLGEVLVNAMP